MRTCSIDVIELSVGTALDELTGVPPPPPPPSALKTPGLRCRVAPPVSVGIRIDTFLGAFEAAVAAAVEPALVPVLLLIP
jgi:hypothetical protein